MTAPIDSQMISQRARTLISELLRVPVDTVTLESSPRTIPKWDSLAQLNLVLQIEQEFGVQLSPAMISRIDDVASIIRVIEEIV